MGLCGRFGLLFMSSSAKKWPGTRFSGGATSHSPNWNKMRGARGPYFGWPFLLWSTGKFGQQTTHFGSIHTCDWERGVLPEKKMYPPKTKIGTPPKFLGNGAIKIDFTPSAPPKIDPMHKYGYILKRASFFQHTIRILGHVVKCRVIGQKARDPPPRADYRAIF